MSRTALAAAILLVMAPPVAVHAEDALPLAPSGAPAGAFPKPDRPVAEIVAPQWALEKERDAADEAGQVARLLDVQPGQTVADVGAGNGYYVFRFAKRVGPGGRVLAEDITPSYLADLQRRVAASGETTITVVKGEAHDPRLPPASVDRAVLVHMYHEIDQPFGLLWNLAAAMKPGGRVGIVDANDIPSKHGTPPKLLRCELSAVGYREVSMTVLTGGVGYLGVFEAPAPDKRPDPASIRPCKDETTRAKR